MCDPISIEERRRCPGIYSRRPFYKPRYDCVDDVECLDLCEDSPSKRYRRLEACNKTLYCKFQKAEQKICRLEDELEYLRCEHQRCPSRIITVDCESRSKSRYLEELQDLRFKNSRLEAKVDDLKVYVSDTNQKLEKSKKENRGWYKKFDDKRVECDDYRRRLEEREAQLEDEQSIKQEMERNRDYMRDIIDTYKKDNERYRKDNETLERILRYHGLR